MSEIIIVHLMVTLQANNKLRLNNLRYEYEMIVKDTFILVILISEMFL